MRILIVEDEISVNYSLCEIIKEEGYDVCSAENYQEAMSLFIQEKVDLVLLDIELPDGNGIDLCKNIRKISETPILFLTANDTEDTLVEGLNSGGDDYMTKPFKTKELFARIKSLLRRVQPTHQIKIGDLYIDLNRNEIFKNQNRIEMSKTDFEILKTIVIHQNQIITRQQLLTIIDKDGQYNVEDNTLSVHMRRIREKIGTCDGMPYFETVRGIGYRMNLGVVYGNK
ncbi:MAG: response regulator transcription factor [Longibaculum sp.]